MKINAVIAPKRIRLKNTELLQNKSTIITFLLLVVAVVAGVLFYSLFNELLNENLCASFTAFSELVAEKSKPEIFSGLLLSIFIYLLLVFLFSTSVIGAPFIYILSFLKLMGLGAVVAYIYSAFGLKGIEYCLLVLLPGKFFLILAIMILTDSAVHLSRSIRLKDSDNVIEYKIIFARFILVFIIATLSVLIDYATCIFFSSLFDF